MRASLTSLISLIGAIALVFTSLMSERAPSSRGEPLRLRAGSRSATVARSLSSRLQLASARHGKRGQLLHTASYLPPPAAGSLPSPRRSSALELSTVKQVRRQPARALPYAPRAPPLSA